MTKYQLLQEAKEAIIDCLNDGYNGYLCDLHNHVFNEEEYIGYDKTAREWLNDYEEDIFTVFENILRYEKDEFGEVIHTNFTPCDVVNMCWYIAGQSVIEQITEEVSEWNDWWEDPITEEQAEYLVKEINQMQIYEY